MLCVTSLGLTMPYLTTKKLLLIVSTEPEPDGNCKEKNISDIGKKHCSDSYRGISAHSYPDMN
jgi:hypothetical protein